MKRILFHVAAAGSLLLCLAVATLWIRSFFVEERFDSGPPLAPGHTYIIRASNGAIRICSSAFASATPESMGHIYLGDPPGLWTANFTFGWGRWDRLWEAHSGRLVPVRSVSFSFPGWLAMVALGVTPLFWLIQERRRRRRLALGHCLRCGYDLRASAGTCPECGCRAPMPATPSLKG
jgi:hypothetical protein